MELLHNEKWIPGYEGYYSITNNGIISSYCKSKRYCYAPKIIIKASKNKDGHMTVRLWNGKKQVQHFVHQLVMLTFIGPCPSGYQVLHYNDIPNDNNLENLRYGTPSENRQDQFRNKPENRNKYSRNNTSGVIGVYKRKNCSYLQWEAYFDFNSIRYRQAFSTQEEAINHRKHLEELFTTTSTRE